MTAYTYRGRDSKGITVNGEIESANEEIVISKLLERGVIPISIEKSLRSNAGDGSPGGNNSSILTMDVGGWFKRFSNSRGFSIEDLVLLCRQLYSLSKAGIPILKALNIILVTQKKPVLREALKKVITGIESGLSLSKAMAQSPKVFSPIIVNMIHVGENTGRLDEVFSQIAGYLELEKNTIKKLKQITRYPLTVGIFISGAVLVVNYQVVPNFVNMFERLGADLPLPTKILIFSSNIFVNYWWLLLIMLITCIAIFWRVINTEKGLYRWDRAKLKAPLIGNILERVILSRFSRVLAMMLREGVPILRSLSIVADAVGNQYMSKAVLGMQDKIGRGESFTKAAVTSGLFNPVVLQMVAVGEESGSLDILLDEIAQFYEEEVEYDLKRFSDALEPILVIMLGIMVLVLALGVFLPLWDLGIAATRFS